MVDASYRRNHEPHQQGEWFEYTGFRYKDLYDVELHDGTVIKACRPNACTWYGKSRRINDTEVSRVRLVPDDELDSRYCLTGRERIDHQLKLFGDVQRVKGPLI